MSEMSQVGSPNSVAAVTGKRKLPVHGWAGAALALALVLAGCGSDDETSGTTAAAVASTEAEQPDATDPADDEDPAGEEDHDDEDHDDEDPAGEEDHDDEDHDDEDHDDEDPAGEEDHDDEDHADEDHDDEDHDDHDGEGSGGLGAHEHGSAELSVAWVGSDVVIDLISPTQNVFGFEYEPETEEDLAIEAERTEALTASGIVGISEGADCELTEPATADVEREGSHAEVTVSWAFSCANPDEISEVDLGPLFAEFPGFVDIDAEWVSETSQSSAELSPQESTLRLET